MYLSSRTAVNNFAGRFIVALLLNALLLPVIYFGGERKTFAQSTMSAANLSAPFAAPPEAFIAFTDSFPSAGFAAFGAVNLSLAKSLDSATTVFRAPVLPEGLTTAKVPTIRERLGDNLALLTAPLSAFLSVKSASPSAAPLVLPAGTIRFDFDGDSKADVSRFQPANRQ